MEMMEDFEEEVEEGGGKWRFLGKFGCLEGKLGLLVVVVVVVERWLTAAAAAASSIFCWWYGYDMFGWIENPKSNILVRRKRIRRVDFSWICAD